MTKHLEILVEEPSMEAFLQAMLPRHLPMDCTFEVFAFQGKADLLQKVGQRLAGYANWLPINHRVIILVDKDNDDCRLLKKTINDAAIRAKLSTKSSSLDGSWVVLIRVVIEELEAWYFGDWEATRTAYPRVPMSIAKKREFRDPDLIPGGTWEALERVLNRSGYYRNGLRKLEAARVVGQYFDVDRCSSSSFRCFWQGLTSFVDEPCAVLAKK